MKHIKNLITTSLLFLGTTYCIEEQKEERTTYCIEEQKEDNAESKKFYVSGSLQKENENRKLCITVRRRIEDEALEPLSYWAENGLISSSEEDYRIKARELFIKTTEDFLQGSEISVTKESIKGLKRLIYSSLYLITEDCEQRLKNDDECSKILEESPNPGECIRDFIIRH